MLHVLCALLVCWANLGNVASQTRAPGSFITKINSGVSVRLFNATNNENYIYGGIEISRDSGTNWGFPCQSHFDFDAIKVLCRMFGYTRGEGISGAQLGQSSNEDFSEEFTCSGTETTLSSCVLSSPWSGCDASEGVGAICFNNTSDVLELQVVDGEKSRTQLSGRLEVRLKPIFDWGSVCDDGFNARTAAAACNMLNYKYGQAARHSGINWLYEETGVFGSSDIIHLDEVSCQAGENFFDCDHSLWGYHDCSPSEDVGVFCMNSTVRLMSAVKTQLHVGTVELYLEDDGGWHEVCDVDWDDRDAKVVCKELGYMDGIATSKNTLGPVSYGSLTTVASATNFSCDGTESMLQSCTYQRTDLCHFSGSIIDLAGVICFETMAEEANLTDAARIEKDTDASEHAGFLEIRHLGIWGRVCEDPTIFNESPLSDAEANVTCKMMGYAGGKRLGNIRVREGQHHIWLRGLKCHGNESKISECEIPDWGSPGLTTCETPVRVICYKEKLEFKIQEGSNAQSGLVEIVHDSNRLSICADKWLDEEANLACKQLGFNGGRTWSAAESSGSTTTLPDRVVGHVNCDYGNDDFYLCVKGNWSVPKSQCNSGPAGVTCFNKVKIDPGMGSAGVLQVFNETSQRWSAVCRNQFEDVDATVACKELGYTQGKLLPIGAFGLYYASYSMTDVNCTGTESSIVTCPHSTNTAGCRSSDYTSISCFNTTSTGSYRLDDGYMASDDSEASGILRIYQNSTWGYACAETFASDDVRVFCNEVGRALNKPGLSVGVKFAPKSSVVGPYFVTFPNCSASESDYGSCKSMTHLCSGSKAVSLLCASTKAPELRIVNDEMDEMFTGRLQITVNDNTGAICAKNWTDDDAVVACKQINPTYVSGIAKIYPRGTNPFFMSGVDCGGYESSIFECDNDGWRTPDSNACGNNAGEAGVACFKNVVLRNQTVTKDSASGRLSVMRYGRNVDVCFDRYFSYSEALLACSELGYSSAAILAPNADVQDEYYMLKYLQCDRQGVSISECSYSIGYCYDGQVRLLCYQKESENLGSWTVENRSQGIGRFTYNMFDKYTGVVCPKDFADTHAKAYCNDLNTQFSDGRASNTWLSGTEKELVWYSCSPSSPTGSCQYFSNATRDCLNQNYSAGVLCARNSDDFSIRLMDHNSESTVKGRVEIKYGGTWGTVCNKNGGRLQARTLCKQLGHEDGTIITSNPKRFGNGTGPIYMKDVSCTDEYTTFFGCPSAGWGVNDGCTHADDLEVMCYTGERLYPDAEKTYGAVSVMVDGSYRFVCSDGFGYTEATVFCRAQGFTSGVPICCSGIGNYTQTIGVSSVSCTGSEGKLMNCSHVKSPYACYSRQYASVACSYAPATQANDTYAIAMEHYSHGRVYIDHYNLRGHMCSDGFDHVDAQVICRESGFQKGLALASQRQSEIEVVWASNLQCQGTESRLSGCTTLNFGQVQNCNSVASVICLRETDSDDISVRLSFGNTQARGVVEVQINGTWGTVCYNSQTTVDAPEIQVICKQLGYSGGRLLRPDTFSAGNSQVWLSSINCTGSESKIKDCRLTSATDVPGCDSHFNDMMIECFTGSQLVNGDDTKGQLQIQDSASGRWLYVCDSAITDETVATVVCKSLGFTHGMHQCCSAGGPIADQQQWVTSVRCLGTEVDISKCSIQTSSTCNTNDYAYVYCSNTEFPASDNLAVKPMDRFAGPVMVSRHGIEGGVCPDGFSNKEAAVMCHELGYTSGQLLNSVGSHDVSSIVLNQIKCQGTENRIKDCTFPSLDMTTSCSNHSTVSILCLNNTVQYRLNMLPSETSFSGRADIIINGETMYMDNYGISRDGEEPSVFCRSVPHQPKFAYGNVYYVASSPIVSASVPGSSILMTSISCDGTEKDILECPAYFLPSFTSISSSRLMFVVCHPEVELDQGASNAEHAGILTLHSRKMDSYGAVCNENFGEKEADVACRMMGYEHGLVHCCRPFGYSYYDVHFRNFQCTGTEQSLYDCAHNETDTYSPFFCTNRQDYVGLTCYNGTRDTDFELSILGAATSSHTGQLQVTYLSTPGTICNDGWDDMDARVACRQLGYADGLAYSHYRSQFVVSGDPGPFWITNVNCTGTEARLADCKHSGLGKVTTCENDHFAGVLCHSGSEIEYRLAGTNMPHYGRVEVNIDGTWGTICDRYWDSNEAGVLCRQLGYVSGDTFSTSTLTPSGTGPTWETLSRCTGKESNLNDCPHEGWVADRTSSCSSHTRDAGVFCYTSVRLGTGSGKTYNHGPVHYYYENEWVRVCDDGFTDISARKVCQELGFYDGRAVCCSAYSGETVGSVRFHSNISLSCNGLENKLQDCYRNRECQSGFYASVVCGEADTTFNDTVYTFSMNEDFAGAGRLEVTHFGVKGRICTKGWDDKDAKVYCKSKGRLDGMAYQHSYETSYSPASTIGPYWMSSVDCDGTETSLDQCSFNKRDSLGNCTASHTAGAVCFDFQGIQYRLAGENRNQMDNIGRIELSLDYKWGTICSRTWGATDARVACRNLGFTDGEPYQDGMFGYGSGPIWIRDIQCNGTEAALHNCPHTGYRDEVPDGNNLPWQISPCSDHTDDATVFCYKDARLNQKLGIANGALLYSHNSTWIHVCDSSSFSATEAKVACKSLLQGYVDGVPIQGGRFGEPEYAIQVTSVTCTGNEETLSACQISTSGTCSSDTYMSVACFNQSLTSDDMRFQLRLSDDSIRTGDNHGILEVRQNGAWGRICMHGFTDKEATVACKQLGGGFTGGAVYLHLYRNRLPILWSSLSCRGGEVSLLGCNPQTTVDRENCAYDSNDAGVVCFKGEGIKYRLRGGKADGSSGRVEIGIDGNYSTVCSVNWQADNSRVLCKTLGYKDGIPLYERNSDLEYLQPLMSFFLCDGTEPNLLSCLNSGFDYGNNVFYCGTDAYTECYNEEVEITQIRLGDGATNEGRVEVYASGLNKWGTVCDDSWDDIDARVVCRHLGFNDGVAIFQGYKDGTGHILLDNVDCNGTESSLNDCDHIGINSHNCEHSEDAGVRCFYTTTPTPVTTHKSTQPTQTPPSTTKAPIPTSTPKPTTKNPQSTLGPHPTIPSTLGPHPTIPNTLGPHPTIPTTRNPNPTTTRPPIKTTPESIPDQKGQNQDDDKKTKVIVGVCVAIVAAIVLITIVIVIVFKYRAKTKSNIPHERFHNDFIEHGNDGSVAVANRMFDMTNPEGVDPMSSYLADGSEIHLDKAGYATFSKGNSPEEPSNTQEGFSNPLYAAMRNASETGPAEMNVDSSQSTT